MISITFNIGKLDHTLEAKKKYFVLETIHLAPSVQKAYLKRVNSPVEHVTVVQKYIHHSTLLKKAVFATWLNLEDKFGSVPHELIPYVLTYEHKSHQIIT